jgi:hypothetical protein
MTKPKPRPIAAKVLDVPPCHHCGHEVRRGAPESMPPAILTCECRCHVPWRIAHAVR